MAKERDRIDESLAAWLENQPVFFVATAPLSGDGHVNVSPKGLGTFRVLGERRAAYLDLTGSGVETIAHLRENGRICLMFCAFEGPPRIIRLHGRGDVAVPGDAAFADLASRLPEHRGARAIIVVDIERIADSCGYAVPVMTLDGHRDVLDKWTERKAEQGALEDYRGSHNARSIDGLPGLPPAPSGSGQ